MGPERIPVATFYRKFIAILFFLAVSHVLHARFLTDMIDTTTSVGEGIDLSIV
jgi:hypothetical protein